MSKKQANPKRPKAKAAPKAKKERKPKAERKPRQLKAKAPKEPKSPRQPKADSKKTLVIGMIGRPGGATLAQVMEATGWLEKTVRAFMVTVPPKLGLELVSEKVEGVRTYSIKQAA